MSGNTAEAEGIVHVEPYTALQADMRIQGLDDVPGVKTVARHDRVQKANQSVLLLWAKSTVTFMW